MNWFIYLVVLLPLAGYLLSLVVPKVSERNIARLAKATIGFSIIVQLFFYVYWFIQRDSSVQSAELTLYQSSDYTFYLSLYIDRISATFALLGAVVSYLIVSYSTYYLHREEGFKRYFNTILLFFLGYNLVVVSGNLETLFIGWEILGISSFLLIGFYRERYRPVKNSLKVFSIYRLGDVGIIVAMWLSHHLWHSNISFAKLSNQDLVLDHLTQHSWLGLAISLAVLLSAITKSAQFPFSYWLPRAMEGPTPSSAVFYGALAVHMGAFLLLRTIDFWQSQLVVRELIVALGFITSCLSVLTARVQSSVKGQIAYSSLTQIGLIFIEIGLGLEILALIHIAGNALLRCYQLLVSPSVVSYQIGQQQYQPLEKVVSRRISSLERRLYLLCLQEWRLEFFVDRVIWNPIRRIGRFINSFSERTIVYLFSFIVLSALALRLLNPTFSTIQNTFVTAIYLLLAVLMLVQSFTGKRNLTFNWTMIFLHQVLIALAMSIHHHNPQQHFVLYLSGSGLAFILGLWTLQQVEQKAGAKDLYGFKGLVHHYKMEHKVFLLASLIIAGFPISPTFIGEDLLFTGLTVQEWPLAVLLAFSFIITGLAVIRMYARIFLGAGNGQLMTMGAKRSV